MGMIDILSYGNGEHHGIWEWWTSFHRKQNDQRILWHHDGMQNDQRHVIWVSEWPIQGGEDPQDALSCRSFFANEPLITGLLRGKWPVKIRHPVGLRHPARRLVVRIHDIILYEWQNGWQWYDMSAKIHQKDVIKVWEFMRAMNLMSYAEYRLFYRAFLQKRPIILRSLLIVATPYQWQNSWERCRIRIRLDVVCRIRIRLDTYTTWCRIRVGVVYVYDSTRCRIRIRLDTYTTWCRIRVGITMVSVIWVSEFIASYHMSDRISQMTWYDC